MMIKDFLIKFTKNQALFGTFIVSFGVTLGSFFSYLLQFALGRTLAPEDFGTFTSLLSLVSFITFPVGIFSVSMIKVSSELLAKKDFKKLTTLFNSIMLIALILGVLTYILISYFSKNISVFFNISDPAVIKLFALQLSLSFLGIAPAAFLQGLLRYKGYALFSSLSAFFRFVLGATAAYMGFKLVGVYYGLIFATAISVLISFAILSKNLVPAKAEDISSYYKKIISFSIPVFFVQFSIMALSNLDVLFVKRLFTAQEAGYYAGTVTLGKILLFGAGMVASVMFPLISKLYTEKKNYIKTFTQFFVIQHVLVIIGVFIFLLIPKLITLLFFGEGFMHSINYLPTFSIFVGLYVLCNFLVMFFLAVERTSIGVVLVPAVALQFLLLSFFNKSITQVINMNIFVTAILYVTLLLVFVRYRKSHVGIDNRSDL